MIKNCTLRDFVKKLVSSSSSFFSPFSKARSHVFQVYEQAFHYEAHQGVKNSWSARGRLKKSSAHFHVEVNIFPNKKKRENYEKFVKPRVCCEQHNNWLPPQNKGDLYGSNVATGKPLPV